MILLKLLFDKIFWKMTWELIYIWYIKKFVKYYTHIDYLPLFNFAEIMKGRFEYLFVEKKRRVPRIFFVKIFENMNYQFKTLDNSHARDLANLADYEHKILIAKDKRTKARWQNELNVLIKKLENKKKHKFDLNDFTDYIEETFNFSPGSIDVHNINTAKAFGNFQKAIKHNRNAKYKNKK